LASIIERSALSVRMFAARCLPVPVKTRLKAGPLRAVTTAIEQMEARSLSRDFPRDRRFESSAESEAASASMSIIVPIHEAPVVTNRCLTSLERNARKAEIILVNDGSRLPEMAPLIRDFSERNGWSVVHNQVAGGHSAACLAGAGLSRRPYLCLLNSDTVVTPWCWAAMRQAFEANSSIGLAGPCTSSSGNEQTLDVAIKCRLYWSDSQICGFAERLVTSPPAPEILDLPWISGFALFIRRSLWEALGGFDRNLPGYWNDIELCKRVTDAGYRTVWVRSAYIHHLGSQSYRKRLPDQEIEKRVRALVQYIRDKHQWEPPPNASYTKLVKGRDGKWLFQSGRERAHV